MTTTTKTETIIMLTKIGQDGGTDIAVTTEGIPFHAESIARGYTEASRWEQWDCTTCGAQADNNPSRDGDRYDLHTYRHGHKATR